MLTLKDVAAIMDSRTGSGKPKAFQIVFVTADRGRDTGGEVRTIDRATLPRPIAKTKLLNDRWVNVQPLGLSSMTRIHFDLILWLNKEPVV